MEASAQEDSLVILVVYDMIYGLVRARENVLEGERGGKEGAWRAFDSSNLLSFDLFFLFFP